MRPMRREEAEGVVRHVMGDDTILNWHKAEDTCGICPWDKLLKAAAAVPTAVGPALPEGALRAHAAIDNLDYALVEVAK